MRITLTDKKSGKKHDFLMVIKEHELEFVTLGGDLIGSAKVDTMEDENGQYLEGYYLYFGSESVRQVDYLIAEE